MVLFPAPAGPSIAITRRLSGISGSLRPRPVLATIMLAAALFVARLMRAPLRRDLHQRPRAGMQEAQLPRRLQRVHRLLDARARRQPRKYSLELVLLGRHRG